MQKDNIVLVGMPGSGKTSVGKALAEKCGLTLVDMDEAILKRRDEDTVAEIFALEDGEALFRELETSLLEEIAADADRIVLATGGGSCMRAHNRQLMKEIGRVVWLDAPVDVIAERLRDDRGKDRPLLQKGGFSDLKRTLRDLMNKRQNHYAAVSDYHLDDASQTPHELADLIFEEFDLNILGNVFDTVLAIDGPVASGKSSVAREVAKKLGWVHVNTGAMYRCVTLLAAEQGLLDDCCAEKLTAIATSLDFAFGPADENGLRPVLLRGEDVTERIGSQDISRHVSKVADTLGVRSALVDVQRAMAKKGNAVLEGRDISTVVCPEARWKVFLVASLEERAKRRADEFISRGEDVDMMVLNIDIISRDNRDRLRPQGGLKLHPEAIIVDTTDVPMDEVVNTIAGIAGSRTTAQDIAKPQPKKRSA